MAPWVVAVIASTCLTVGLLPEAAAQSPYPRSSEHIATVQRAQDALAAGKADAALTLADGVLKVAPAHRDAAAVKIRALLQLNDRPAALKTYDAWLDAARREDVTLLEPIARAELAALRATPLPLVQGGALEALALAGDADAKKALEAAFRSATPTTLTWEATEALARMGDAAAQKRIVDTASQGASGSRVRAIQAIKTLPKTLDLAAVLRRALANGDVMVQVAVADTAGTLHVKELLPDLRRALPTAEPFARLWIASAMMRLGDGTGEDLLKAALAGTVVDTQLVAAQAYRDGSDTAWVGRIRPLLTADEALNRLFAAELLATVDRPKAFDVLKKGLSDPNHVVRGEAARILTETNIYDIWTLRWMIRDGAPLVRFLAARAILADATSQMGPRPG